jgi:hypothetical protein
MSSRVTVLGGKSPEDILLQVVFPEYDFEFRRRKIILTIEAEHIKPSRLVGIEVNPPGIGAIRNRE